MSAIFSNSLKNQKSHLRQWKPKNHIIILLNVNIQVHLNYFLSRKEVDYDLKTMVSVQLSQVGKNWLCDLVPQALMTQMKDQ